MASWNSGSVGKKTLTFFEEFAWEWVQFLLSFHVYHLAQQHAPAPRSIIGQVSKVLTHLIGKEKLCNSCSGGDDDDDDDDDDHDDDDDDDHHHHHHHNDVSPALRNSAFISPIWVSQSFQISSHYIPKVQEGLRHHT